MSEFILNLNKKKSKLSKKESQKLADKSLKRIHEANKSIKSKIGCELRKRRVKAENAALLRNELKEVWE